MFWSRSWLGKSVCFPLTLLRIPVYLTPARILRPMTLPEISLLHLLTCLTHWLFLMTERGLKKLSRMLSVGFNSTWIQNLKCLKQRFEFLEVYFRAIYLLAVEDNPSSFPGTVGSCWNLLTILAIDFSRHSPRGPACHLLGYWLSFVWFFIPKLNTRVVKINLRKGVIRGETLETC